LKKKKTGRTKSDKLSLFKILNGKVELKLRKKRNLMKKKKHHVSKKSRKVHKQGVW